MIGEPQDPTEATSLLVKQLEEWLWSIAHQRVPAMEDLASVELCVWGTTNTSWYGGPDDPYQGYGHIETYLYTPATYFISADPRVAQAVKLYLAFTNQPDVGRGTNYQIDYPDWYLDSTPEPPLFTIPPWVQQIGHWEVKKHDA